MRIQVGSLVKDVLDRLNCDDACIVGGYVRDKILGRKPKDIDIVSTLPLSEVSKRLKLKPYIVNDRFKTARFSLKGTFIDYNEICDLRDDLARRDFTVNSLACGREGRIIDCTNGLNDINKRIIRPSSSNSLTDDPLRMLRAFRLKASLGFRFSQGLGISIKRECRLHSGIPKERIYAELYELFSKSDRGGFFRELYEAGVLLVLFPELLPSVKFIHVKHKSRYLIGHLLNTAEAVDRVMKLHMPSEMRDYASKNLFTIYLSALLHDIYKPECFTLVSKRQRFFNHDTVAAKRIGGLLRDRIKAPNDESQRAALLISLHMRPHYLLNQDATDRGIYRLYREAGRDSAGLMILCAADILASEGRIEKGYFTLFRRMKLIEKRIEKREVRILNGDEIMAYFKLKPGKLIGEMLESGNGWAVEYNITDKLEILKYLKKEFSL